MLGLADSLGGSGKEVAEAFFCRGESDLEHQAKVGWLTLAFLNNFPGFFGELTNKSGFQPEIWSIITVALCHDVGEVEIGDIPDDGRPEHDLKNDTELRVFKTLMRRAFCSYNASEAIAVFERFQQKHPLTGAALFMLDKLEAVLTLLFLEKHGAVGNLENKVNLTAQDKYFMRAAESNNPADVWAIHFKLVVQGFPKSLSEPVLKILAAAFVDVRGKLPEWWNKEVQPCEK